jgi:AbrB family looped-hinge helix DNA binding protein
MEVDMITTVRVQEKGQVTIPSNIRRRLKLKKGDLVTFVATENSVVIKTLDLAASDLLEILAKKLQAKGISLNIVLERAQNMSSEAITREFGLANEERAMLFQALQLKAQAAVEAIRASAEANGSSDLTDEDIEKEIQEARDELSHADRT